MMAGQRQSLYYGNNNGNGIKNINRTAPAPLLSTRANMLETTISQQVYLP